MTYQSVLDALMRNGKISETAADHVFRVYRKINVLRFNAHDGYRLTHGGFFDHAVIKRTLDQFPVRS